MMSPIENIVLETSYTPEDIHCGGGVSPSYWRTFASCSDGTYVAGTGVTKEEAEKAALQRAADRNTFLSSGPQARLREIASRPYLLANDVTQAIKAIAEILLKEPAS